MTRIDMWPVLDHGGFRLDGDRLVARVGGMGGPHTVADGLARNVHLVCFLADRGDGAMVGRHSQAAVASALGFGDGEWESNLLPGARLTDEEWGAASRTPGIVLFGPAKVARGKRMPPDDGEAAG